MAQTHWREAAGAWEFLGAYADGYKGNPRSGQVYGRIITIPGSPQEILDRLSDRTQLVDLPASIRKRLASDQEVSFPFEQVEGFLK